MRRSWGDGSEAAFQWKTQEPWIFPKGVKLLLEKGFTVMENTSVSIRQDRKPAGWVGARRWCGRWCLPRSEGIAQLARLKGLLSLSSRASGAATVREGEWSKWTSGVIQPGNFHLSGETQLHSQCSGVRERAVCLYLCFKKYTHLAGFPASRQPDQGGYHPQPTKLQMMCGVNSMETHRPRQKRTAAPSMSLSSPAWEALECIPLLPPSLQETEKMLLLRLLLTVPSSWSVCCAKNT